MNVYVLSMRPQQSTCEMAEEVFLDRDLGIKFIEQRIAEEEDALKRSIDTGRRYTATTIRGVIYYLDEMEVVEVIKTERSQDG
jgi:hypothetical protein